MLTREEYRSCAKYSTWVGLGTVFAGITSEFLLAGGRVGMPESTNPLPISIDTIANAAPYILFAVAGVSFARASWCWYRSK